MDDAKTRQKRYNEKKKQLGYTKQAFFVKNELSEYFKDISRCLNSINDKNTVIADQVIKVIIKHLERMSK